MSAHGCGLACVGLGETWVGQGDRDRAEMTRVDTAPDGGWMALLERLEMTAVGHQTGCAQGIRVPCGSQATEGSGQELQWTEGHLQVLLQQMPTE